MFDFTSKQRACFEILLVWVLLFDITSQVHYMTGPLCSAPALTSWAPWLGGMLGIFCIASKHARRPSIALLVVLHYSVTYSIGNGQYTSEADAWIWLMGFALVCIPADGDETQSYWVAVLKLIGFLVYFYAGLNKVIHEDWWNGEALTNILLDPTLVKAPFSGLANWPGVCQILGWLTLLQRLIVPWGLWSNRLTVRRLSAGILLAMHLSYVLVLNIGIFSWVGILYLSPFFFRSPKPQAEYYRLPRHRNWVSLGSALVFVSYLILIPGLAFAEKLGFSTADEMPRWTPPGFNLRWAMFAKYPPGAPLLRYSIKTCSGEELFDDQIYWRFGTSSDYFRRRFWTRELTFELYDAMQSETQGTPVPLEQKVIDNFPRKISERRWQILAITEDGPRLLSDTGYQKISNCPGDAGKR